MSKCHADTRCPATAPRVMRILRCNLRTLYILFRYCYIFYGIFKLFRAYKVIYPNVWWTLNGPKPSRALARMQTVGASGIGEVGREGCLPARPRTVRHQYIDVTAGARTRSAGENVHCV